MLTGWWKAIAATLLATVPAGSLMVLIFAEMAQPLPSHIDEIYWIGSAYYYHLAFVERDWPHPAWTLLPARENPPVGKYLIGSWLSMCGCPITTPNELGAFYLLFARRSGVTTFDPTIETRGGIDRLVEPTFAQRVLESGRFPIDPMRLICARRLMLLLGLTTAVGIVVIGRQLGSTLAGSIASILFALHPVVVASYCFAMVDMIPLMFSTWSISALLQQHRSLQSGTHRGLFRTGLSILGLGILQALACGAKMNALVVVAVTMTIGAGWLAVGIYRRRRNDVVGGLCLLGTPPIGLICFVLTNPTCVAQPFRGLQELVTLPAETVRLQAEFDRQLTSPQQRWLPIADRVLRWPMLLAPLLAGVVTMTLRAGRSGAPMMVVLAWWWISTTALLAWLPFNWERYVLPMIPPTLLIVGMVGGTLASTLKGWRRQRSSGIK